MNNDTVTEKARQALKAMADETNVSAVARLLGIPQPTLHRFVTDPDRKTSLSLRNFEKVLPYINQPHQKASGE